MESSEDDLRAGNGIHLKQSDKAPTLQRPKAPPMTSVSIPLTTCDASTNSEACWIYGLPAALQQ